MWLWRRRTMTLFYRCCLVLSMLGTTFGQDKDFSVLQRHSLVEYSLAKCTDGTPAAYYADRVNNSLWFFNYFLTSSWNWFRVVLLFITLVWLIFLSFYNPLHTRASSYFPPLCKPQGLEMTIYIRGFKLLSRLSCVDKVKVIVGSCFFFFTRQYTISILG